MNPHLETYLIAGILTIHLGMVVFTLFHICSRMGLRPPSHGGYWFLFVLVGGFVGYLLYWTCRSRVEQLLLSIHEWGQRRRKRHDG